MLLFSSGGIVDQHPVFHFCTGQQGLKATCCVSRSSELMLTLRRSNYPRETETGWKKTKEEEKLLVFHLVPRPLSLLPVSPKPFGLSSTFLRSTVVSMKVIDLSDTSEEAESPGAHLGSLQPPESS